MVTHVDIPLDACRLRPTTSLLPHISNPVSSHRYLLFDDDHDLHRPGPEHIFTTEGHVIPLSAAYRGSTAGFYDDMGVGDVHSDGEGARDMHAPSTHRLGCTRRPRLSELLPVVTGYNIIAALVGAPPFKTYPVHFGRRNKKQKRKSTTGADAGASSRAGDNGEVCAAEDEQHRTEGSQGARGAKDVEDDDDGGSNEDDDNNDDNDV
eukprot:m.116002 g.116002  ORF g.116002 m.116002 type:complete len:207 (-) comp10899_c0_seq2:115-735(-)